MGVYLGWGNESKSERKYSQFELRQRWEVTEAATQFHRIFNVGLLGFVGEVETVFSPPASVGFLFKFGPGMREPFARLIDERMFPPKTLDAALRTGAPAPGKVIPDNPGLNNRDAWWRSAAAGAAIGASFREGGTQTSVHIAFNKDECDVHVDRNGFVLPVGGGNTQWDLNGLLRHMTIDLAGDKAPWALLSVGYVNSRNRPIFQATLSPWLAVDLPSRETGDRTAVKVGIAITGSFGGR